MIINMRALLLFSFVLLNFFMGETVAMAQFDGLSGLSETTIELKPKHPQPGELVEATLNSGGNDDLFGANITWFLDGKEITSAQNSRSTEFLATKAGLKQSMKAVLTKPNSPQKTIEKNFTPLYLDIIFEPQTHAPSFYSGRTSASMGSVVNATAILSGEEIITTDLVYRWEVGGNVIGDGFVRGQNKVSINTPRGKYILLDLKIRDLSGNQIAERSVFLPSVEPKIIFHEVSPLFGIREIPIKKSLSMIGNTAVVRAVPYYIDSRVYNEPDLLEWKIGGVMYDNYGQNPYDVTLQKTGFSGQTSLEFHIRNLSELSQGAEASINVNLP